jgi:hypothetical protein
MEKGPTHTEGNEEKAKVGYDTLKAMKKGPTHTEGKEERAT